MRLARIGEFGGCLALSMWLALGALTRPAAVAAASAAPAPLLDKPAPDFALPAAAGSNVRLSEHRGEVVVLSFWSSRCSLCAEQLTAVNGLYATYRSAGLIVLGVSVDDDMAHARAYARSHTMRFPLLLDGAKQVSRNYAVDRLPTTVLIDRAGNVRYVHADYRPADASYVAEIRALLDDAPVVSSSSVAE